MSTHPLFPDEPMESTGFLMGKKPKADDRTTFDLAQGELARERGIEMAAAHEASLGLARDMARQIARELGEVTADDVQLALNKIGFELLGKSAGSLFRTKEWIFTGKWRKSERVSNHGHENRVWRLR